MTENTNKNTDQIKEVSYEEAQKRMDGHGYRSWPYNFKTNGSYMVMVEIFDDITMESMADPNFNFNDPGQKVIQTFCYNSESKSTR